MEQQVISQYIKDGILKKIIQFNEDNSRITYFDHIKSRNYNNPEERVQAEIYCQLILKYGYPKEQIKNFVSVTMGSTTKEADIIVYSDKECKKPYIIIECKEEEVSEQAFKMAEDQAFSYAYALAGDTKWIWVTSRIKNTFFKFDKNIQKKEDATDIPSYGVNEIAPYKFVKDAKSIKEQKGQQFFDLSIVTEDELTHRFKQAHNALWAGGQLNPSEAFDELDKLIFCKIWDERKARKTGEPYDFQIIIEKGKDEKETRSRTNQALQERVYALYEEGRKKDPEVFKDNIRLSAERIRTIVEYLQDINLNKTDLDSKGRAFETFMGSFFRGNFGQFFTPRPIVKFIVDVLPITHESVVLDTSCGSGGFLLQALEKVRREADTFYDQDSKEHWRHWHDFAEKNLYGIEINEQISRAAKMNMIIHDDGHTNVITADGLLSDKALQEFTKNQGFKYNRFDFIITNPPFGSAIKQNEKAYLTQYNFGNSEVSWLDTANTKVKARATQSTEVLFIEQCYYFLQEYGYLAVVIPDGILTNSSLQYVRDQIEDWYRIVAVISLPQTAFTATGAGVKSSVLFLRKYPEKYTQKLKEQKIKLQDLLKAEKQYIERVESLEAQSREIVNKANGITYEETTLAEFKKTDQYKKWRTEIQAEYREKINTLKDNMEDLYLQKRQSELPDYSIFMALAEDIGYDATGKNTGKNELNFIGTELKRFINEEVEGEKYE